MPPPPNEPATSVLARIVATALWTLVILAVAAGLERLAARDGRPRRTLVFNVSYAGVMAVLAALFQPITRVEGAWVRAALHVNSVALPTKGWGILLSATIVLLCEDLIFYWVHRAQHRFAWLWAMHSFHHSDDDLNAATAFRHFWLEKPVWMLVLYLPLGLVFQISAPTAALYGFMFQFFAFFPHMGLRLELGPLTRVVMGPQVHRIHHSIYREHFDTNFAGAFPLWDLLFRTYRAPGPGEFPPTGIQSLPGRPSVRETLMWPLWYRQEPPEDQGSATRAITSGEACLK